MNKIFFVFLMFVSSFFMQGQNLVADLEYHVAFDKSLYPFFHGVASGDATSEKVIIWTRVTPERQMRSITVNWNIATDSLMKNSVKNGLFTTDRNRDYTVKIDVDGLKPNTIYYYQFEAFKKKSCIGRTKTLPQKNKNIDNFRAVFFTGSNYNAGYFNAYKSVVLRNDIDAVYHLGDYFYEYGTNEYGHNKNRSLMPDYELVTLSDYRTRFSHYRLDKDLQEAHRKYCWYVVWDDHETADNSYLEGAQNHQKNEGDWQKRMADAKQAYFEWMPIRETKDSSIYSTYDVGKMARFILLDTRLEGRQFQGIDAKDTAKTMLGKEQLEWLFYQLLKAQKDSVEWIFITQQVMFAPFMIAGQVLNNDQWDGYQYERQKICDFIAKNNINNVVIISGDIHTSWANEVYIDKKNKDKIIPEFITPSITSFSTYKFTAFFAKIIIKITKPYIRYVDLTHKGYMILDLNRDSILAEWYYLKTIKKQNPKINRVRKYSVEKGQPMKIKKEK